jgi:hypothetical protein
MAAVVDVLPLVPVTPTVNRDSAHVGAEGGGRKGLIPLEDTAASMADAIGAAVPGHD